MDTDDGKRRGTNSLPWWVKSIVLLLFSVVSCYKIAFTEWNVVLDFPTLLSLLLAFFSVGLAALFYFKATESSNAFYDNTYKFSQEVGGLLARIESGFGERLRHLDEAYKGMRDDFDRLPSGKIKDTKRELKEEEQEFEKLVKEREEIIEQLAAKAQLKDEEKESILQDLKHKEKALEEARSEIAVLRHRLEGALSAGARSYRIERAGVAVGELRKAVLDRLPIGFRGLHAPDALRRAFSTNKEALPPELMDILSEYGLVDESGDLTANGVDFILRRA